MHVAMDILKELFGTSDELQISKSLFGSDAPHAATEELVLGEEGRTCGVAYCPATSQGAKAFGTLRALWQLLAT